jgi:hypothetical protein
MKRHCSPLFLCSRCLEFIDCIHFPSLNIRSYKLATRFGPTKSVPPVPAERRPLFAQPLPLTRPDRPSLENGTPPHAGTKHSSHHLATPTPDSALATFLTSGRTLGLGLLRFCASPLLRFSALNVLEPATLPSFTESLVFIPHPLLALDLFRRWEQCAPRETTSGCFRTSTTHRCIPSPVDKVARS